MTAIAPDPTETDRAELIRAALEILAVAPEAVGGLWLRGRAGPARDAVTRALTGPLPQRRLSAASDAGALSGGIDVAATLASGKTVERAGLDREPALLLLATAERCESETAARLGQILDAGRHSLVALDEGLDDEAPPKSLTDRLGLFLAPDEDAWRDAAAFAPRPDRIAAAQGTLSSVSDGDASRLLVEIAAALGVPGLRAPAFALRAARASAALAGRGTVAEDDLRRAAELCLAHRATALPGVQDAEPPSPPQQDGEPSEGGKAEDVERIVDAARAVLPPGLAAALAAGRSRSARGAGAGASRAGARKGRPLASRPGRLDGRARVDIVATLTAAAPFQAFRGRSGAGVRVQPSDIRLRKYRERAERLLIFAVDASGSAAAARLAEAKGAVELLLAGAYSSRDNVALIAFRGAEAQLVLSPTRSLSLTRKRLAGLPGGGGTPLATALAAADELACQAARRGLTPALVLLTDGRANVALDGAGGRERARQDAVTVARRIAGTGLKAVALDTGRRPEAWLAELAATMGASYLPLPRADAAGVSAAVSAALPR